MAGGNWSAQNKIKPGAYINFQSKADVNYPARGTIPDTDPEPGPDEYLMTGDGFYILSEDEYELISEG